MKREVIAETIAFVLIAVLTYAAVSKMADLGTFQASLRGVSWLVPFSGFLALLVPLTEIAAVFLLAIPCCRDMGFRIVAVMAAVFTFYIGYQVALENGQPCGCGGVIGTFTWTQHMIFNFGFLGLSLLGILVSPAREFPVHTDSIRNRDAAEPQVITMRQFWRDGHSQGRS